jgi:glycosyltransferase involved in cell wall biosynthesis
MHLIDGDFDTWAYSPPISSKVRTTATFHQPIDKLPEITAPLKAGLLDGIVCVSRNQIPLVQHLVPAGRCVFIPHGVDTQFFCPGSGGIGGDVSPTEPMVLTVGSHRRDFATLVATAKLVHAVRRDVKFILIGPREKVGHVEAASGGIIKVLSGVSDQELCDAYRRAAVVLLPLEEATANNSLLEGAACGRPIVVSDLPAITDYVEGDQVLRAPVADAKAHADATLRILSDASLARRLGQGAYETVQSYAWPLVNDRARAFFQSVIDG